MKKMKRMNMGGMGKPNMPMQAMGKKPPMAAGAPAKMTGIQNAISKRMGNLDQFKSRMQEKMASNPKLAEMVAKKKAMIDKSRSRMDQPRTMKSGGMVRGAGCATRGKKISKKMG